MINYQHEKSYGNIFTTCKVANHVDRKKSVEIPKLLVDTGSEFTWVLADTLKKAGITREKKDYTFVMANGQQITRTIGFAILHVGDPKATPVGICTVAFIRCPRRPLFVTNFFVIVYFSELAS